MSGQPAQQRQCPLAGTACRPRKRSSARCRCTERAEKTRARRPRGGAPHPRPRGSAAVRGGRARARSTTRSRRANTRTRLNELADEVDEHAAACIMRVYFEKPRTTVGWKGLINDPDMDDSFHIEKGIRAGARAAAVPRRHSACRPPPRRSTRSCRSTCPSSITWTAIGARTTESQTHREMASGLSTPVGFKNGTDGIADGRDQRAAVGAPPAPLPRHQRSRASRAVFRTRGNRYGHIVLRGGGGAAELRFGDASRCASVSSTKAGAAARTSWSTAATATPTRTPGLQPLVAENVRQPDPRGQPLDRRADAREQPALRAASRSRQDLAQLQVRRVGDRCLHRLGDHREAAARGARRASRTCCRSVSPTSPGRSLSGGPPGPASMLDAAEFLRPSTTPAAQLSTAETSRVWRSGCASRSSPRAPCCAARATPTTMRFTCWTAAWNCARRSTSMTRVLQAGTPDAVLPGRRPDVPRPYTVTATDPGAHVPHRQRDARPRGAARTRSRPPSPACTTTAAMPFAGDGEWLEEMLASPAFGALARERVAMLLLKLEPMLVKTGEAVIRQGREWAISITSSSKANSRGAVDFRL
ncbi:MAG: hypothetical protein MZV65_41225 [Chromatiales bacterium]|nr:hypothetical protein [Chromatiales bacterium]